MVICLKNICDLFKKKLVFKYLGDIHNNIQLYMGWCICQMTHEAHGSLVKTKQ